MMPLHPPGRAMHETLAEDAGKSLLADRPGFDDLWIGGHFSASEPVASPMMSWPRWRRAAGWPPPRA